MEENELKAEAGPIKAPDTFYIKIIADGPYLVYGQPPVDQEIIRPNEEGNSWVYQKGTSFKSSDIPCALCRCGGSHHKPFCDESHKTEKWEPEETAGFESLLAGAEQFEGKELILTDNIKYCAFARFCDAYGQIWNLVEKAETDEEKELVRREAAHCPAGRLIVWEKSTGKPYEPMFEPSIGIIEDPGLKISGPIWVKGGIRIESADGTSYEIRNRVTLCRCGQSSNKPFCDGTHASMRFTDHIPSGEGGSEW